MKIKMRNSDWLDVKNGYSLYSFQIYHNQSWHNPMENGKPMIYATPAERDIAKARTKANLIKKQEQNNVH